MDRLHRVSRHVVAAGARAATGARRRKALASIIGAAAGVMVLGPGAQASEPPRSWELVSPPAKNNADIAPNALGAYVIPADNGKVAFASMTAFGDALSSGLLTVYVAERGSGAWTTRALSPPMADGGFSDAPFLWWSDDLRWTVLRTLQGPPLVPNAPLGYANLYLRDNKTDTYQLITNVTPPDPVNPNGGDQPVFEGMSADRRHIIFSMFQALTPDAPRNYEQNLYESVDGTLRLVGVLPDGMPAPRSEALGGQAQTLRHAISDDGSRIFFYVPPSSNLPEGDLYVRINGTTTVQTNKSRKTNGSGVGGTDPAGPRPAAYVGATSDGTAAYFLSSEELTNDATAANGGRDLYRYDVDGNDLTDLTVDPNGDPNGADVFAVLGMSDDGDYVYFAASGKLASGATAGSTNLYLWHDGAVRFIGNLDATADIGFFPQQSAMPVRITPDGRYLAYQSVVPQTAYDNTDAVTGTPDSEVYLYDAGDNEVTCVSCNPSGPPRGPSSLDKTLFLFKQWSELLTPDGSHLMFTSRDALVPEDTNGRQDVYEYADGAVRLISSGTGSTDAYAGALSPDGIDAYFLTREPLVRADTDMHVDLYDAREGSSFPEAPLAAPPCQPAACRPAPTPGPLGSDIGSMTFAGTGNVVDPRQRVQRSLEVASIGAAQRRTLVRTGKLTLRVRVIGGGLVKARVRARLGRSMAVVATRDMRVESTGARTISLPLRLSATARRTLGARGRLPIIVSVALAGAQTKQAKLTLLGPARPTR